MPRVSIIIPVYNAARDLPRCLRALEAQTLNELEPILIDDGSTDDSLALCRAFAATHPQARVLSQANAGAAAARNAGLDVATGDYIAFWDADDFAAPRMLETLWRLCEQNACDIAECELLSVPANATEAVFPDSDAQPEIISGIDAIGQLYGEHYARTVVLWNKLYRREIWQELRIPTGHICEDEAILHEALYRAARIAVLPTPLYAYRQSENSVMRTKGSLKRLDILWALERRGEFLRQKQLDTLSVLNDKVLLTQYLHCANYLLDNRARIPDAKQQACALIARYRAAYRKLPASHCSRKQRLQYAVYDLLPRSEAVISRWLER